MGKKLKTIGVLGGMGPGASALFYDHLVAENKQAQTDQEHPPVIIYSNSQVPDRMGALLRGTKSPVGEMVRSFRLLEEAGADFGVVMCNTAHTFLGEVKKKVKLPIVNIIEETVRYVLAKYPKNKQVGILATTPTLELGLYEKAFAKKGIEVVLPAKADQELVMDAIFNRRYGIKNTGKKISLISMGELLSVANRMKRGRTPFCVVDGCTEISLALGDERRGGIQFIDPMKISAWVCLEKSGIRL